MITGSINPIRQATLPLSIKDETSGQFVDFNMVVDTGFSGDVQLPIDDIIRLNLPFVDRGYSQLADGRMAGSDVYGATVLWFGNSVLVNVIAAESPILLIGAKLLWGYVTHIEWQFGGRVSVEPIPRPEPE